MMTSVDGNIQQLAKLYYVHCFLLLILCVILFRYGGFVYHIGYAWAVNIVCSRINGSIKRRKEGLFLELEKMATETKRNLNILEIGVGSGNNFLFMPKDSNVICLDPNKHFEKYIKAKEEQYSHLKIKEFVTGRSEELSFIPDESIDVVICTFVLCSVSDITVALGEITRVLRKGGKFFYVEHIAAESGSWTYKLQCLFNPVFRRVADNCHLSRQIDSHIENASFDKVEHYAKWIRARFGILTIFPLHRRNLIGVSTK